HCISLLALFLFFFFTDPTSSDFYTLSLHDALPIFFSRLQMVRLSYPGKLSSRVPPQFARLSAEPCSQRSCDCSAYLIAAPVAPLDRKSTRLNSSHLVISYAVFCLKKKTIEIRIDSV